MGMGCGGAVRSGGPASSNDDANQAHLRRPSPSLCCQRACYSVASRADEPTSGRQAAELSLLPDCRLPARRSELRALAAAYLHGTRALEVQACAWRPRRRREQHLQAPPLRLWPSPPAWQPSRRRSTRRLWHSSPLRWVRFAGGRLQRGRARLASVACSALRHSPPLARRAPSVGAQPVSALQIASDAAPQRPLPRPSRVAKRGRKPRCTLQPGVRARRPLAVR